MEQLVDFVVDGKSLDVDETNLPDGSFGFEYCCGRSFVGGQCGSGMFAEARLTGARSTVTQPPSLVALRPIENR